MTGGRCGTCAGEGGLGGPCPECGAHPAVVVLDAAHDAASEVRSVSTTGSRSRSVALAVVLVLVGLVVASIAWDAVSSDDNDNTESAGEPEQAESTTTTTTRPRPRSTNPSRGALGDDIPIAPAVEGFEGQWLIVVDHNSGAVVQVPLGGGEVVTILGRASDRSLGPSYPIRLHLVDDTLIGVNGSVSLLDGSFSPYHRSDHMAYIMPIGVTEANTIIFGGDVLAEGSTTGERIADLDFGALDMDGAFVAVRGRQLIHSGFHGIHRIDIDSGRAVRIHDGVVVGVGREILIARSCSSWQACTVQVVDLDDGSVQVTLQGDVGTGRFGFRYGAGVAVSPDDTRVVAAVDGRLSMFDLETGVLLGRVDMRENDEGEDYGLAQVIWAPDSRSVMVLEPDSDWYSFGGGYSAWIDRDFRSVRPLGDLGEVLAALGPGHDQGFVLSNRPFEPVPVE